MNRIAPIVALPRRLATAILAISLLGSTQCSGDETRAAPGFSEERFSTIHAGMSRAEVDSALGSPLLRVSDPFPETWLYENPAREGPFRLFEPNDSVAFDNRDRVSQISGPQAREIRIGDTKESVRKAMGAPARIVAPRSVILWYTLPGDSGRYRARGVALNSEGRVAERISYETWE